MMDARFDIKRYLLGFFRAMLTFLVGLAVGSSITLALLLARRYLHFPLSVGFSLGMGVGIALSVNDFIARAKGTPRISNSLKKNVHYLLDQFVAFAFVCFLIYVITQLNYNISRHDMQSRYLPVIIGFLCGRFIGDVVYYGWWRPRPQEVGS